MTSLREKIAKLSPERQEKIATRTAELIREELNLRDLRKARELTQVQLAKVLNVKQVSVSQIEKRADVMLSTMRGYVEALGGKLELVAHFPDRGDVVIKNLQDLGEKPNAPRKASKTEGKKAAAHG
jgi:transcriptional regulator with XRE-family HTH domain